MIILLIFASVFSAVISYIQKESYADSVIILIIVIINATLSFIEEKKADKAIEELNKMFITNNNVIRDGKKETIDVTLPGKKIHTGYLHPLHKVVEEIEEKPEEEIQEDKPEEEIQEEKPEDEIEDKPFFL